MDTRWAQPAVSNLASVPYDGDYYKPSFEQHLSVHSPPLTTIQTPSITTTVFFPPQRVEPIDMARSNPNRDKTGYIQSATTDPQQTIPSYLQNQPIKRLLHPADRSSFIAFIQRFSRFCLTIFLSLPCVILLSLLLPICWLVRAFLRLTCRYHCTVTPCTCSYLSASDLFWFYNSNTHRDKSDRTTKLNSSSISPLAAAVFYLEGKKKIIRFSFPIKVRFLLSLHLLGTINENSLKKLLVNRLITTSIRRGSDTGRKLFPRFSQLVVSRFSGTMWVDYSLFSIDEHVREIPRNIQSDDDLQSYISTLLSTELTRTRPLWQLHYKNRSSTRPNDSILIFLYHPVLSDGVSLLRILLKHIVDNRTTQLDIKPRFAGRHDEHMFDYLKAYLFGHLLIFSKLFFNTSRESFFKRTVLVNSNTNDNNLATIDSSSQANQQQQQQRRIVTWSNPFSLTQANRMKLVTRTRMNDLLSTLVISTVKLYMEQYG